MVNMKRRLVYVVSLLVVMLLSGGVMIHASALDAYSGAGSSKTEYSNPHPAQITSAFPQVIVVSGSNYDMGYQYAEQAMPLIYHNHIITWNELATAYGEEIAAKEMGVWAYYLWKYNPGLKDWYKGMSDACKKNGYDLSIIDLVAISLYPTQLWARPDAPYPEETGVKGAAKVSENPAGAGGYHSCTSFSATGSATADGKPIVSVTKMVPLQSMQCLILVAFPKEGPSFVTFPQAGTVSANSGMNNAGFAMTNTAIFGPLAWSYPIEGYFHYLPQYAHSVSGALDYLKSTPRGGVMGTVNMGDAAGNISVFEGNALEFAIRKHGNCGEAAPFLIQTNHHVNPALLKYNIPWEKWGWNIGSYYRYATAFKYASDAAASGKLDLKFVKKMWSSDNWYDPKTDTWHYNEPGSRNLNNNFPGSLSQAIFFPADRIAYFEVGTPSGIGLPGGATGEYVKLQLADRPAKVTSNASKAAFDFYSEARNLFAKELNNDAPYLTYSIAQSLEEKLDEAALEYERGMDRAALASLAGIEGAAVNEQMALWSDALTHFANTQLYAQMVTTQMEKLAH